MSELAESNISIVNDVFIKQIYFAKAGDTILTHAHVHDHQTLLANGRIKLTTNGDEAFWQAPSILLIEAGMLHKMEAMEDGTVAYCIHAIRGAESVDEAEPLVRGISNRELSHLA